MACDEMCSGFNGYTCGGIGANYVYKLPQDMTSTESLNKYKLNADVKLTPDNENLDIENYVNSLEKLCLTDHNLP